MKYTICSYLGHVEQKLSQSLDWHDASLKTERDREVYKAAFIEGARSAKGLISLHAGLNLSDPRVK